VRFFEIRSLIVMLLLPLTSLVGQSRKAALNVSGPAGSSAISQERLEGFYLEMPTTYLLPKEIQSLLKATVQGKAELEDRYSKLYTDKIRLGNLLFVQVEGTRNVIAKKLKQDTLAFDMEMSVLKADYGVKNFQEVLDRLAKAQKALDTRTYPSGYTTMQVTNLHLEAAKLRVVLDYDKNRNDTQKDLGLAEGVLALIRDWMK